MVKHLCQFVVLKVQPCVFMKIALRLYVIQDVTVMIQSPKRVIVIILCSNLIDKKLTSIHTIIHCDQIKPNKFNTFT